MGDHQRNINFLDGCKKQLLNKVFGHEQYVKSYFAIENYREAEKHVET